MARLGRSYSRPLVLGPHASDASVTLGDFITTSVFPDLSVTAPSAAVTLTDFITTSTFPDLTIHYDTSITLGDFITTSTFPGLIASAPILPGDSLTGDYQIEWAKSILFGPPPYVILSVEGWDDLPDVDSGNAPRAARHGSWPGRDFAQERVVQAVIAISDDADGFPVSRRDFRRLINVSESGTEADLVIRTGTETLRAKAKVQGRVMPTESYGQGFTQVSVKWVCSDPRRYDLAQQSVTVGEGSTNICQNDGDIATSPLIKVNGPVTNPVITNTTLNRILTFNITLADGEQMLIDTDAGTVTVGGDDQMSTLSTSSVPVEEWVLGAGPNTISFTADSGGTNPIELLFASAYL